MDDNNLSPAEEKFFETRGQAELPLPEEKPEAEKPVEGDGKAEEKSPEKAPEQKAPPEIEIVEDDDESEEPDARKYVKVGVLRKEREQRKALRNEVEQTKQQLAALQRQIEAAKNPPREITAEEAPHIALQRVQQLEETLANNAAKQQFVSSYAQAAQTFSKEQADFPEAYKHALGVRRTMYEMAGFNADEVNTLLESEEASIVQRAFQAGENPAKKLYEIAKTLGYSPKAKEEPKPDPTANKVVDAATKLAKIADGMSKNKSVQGGGAADSGPSLEELAEMDDAEFEKATAGKNWRKMMGG